MQTERIKIDPNADHTEAVRRAAETLARGGLVAFPTETVYGVAVRADNSEGMQRLRDLKSRATGQAFTVHIGSPREAPRFAPGMKGLACRFIRKAWPGPLTLILQVDDPALAPVMAGLDASTATAMYFQNTVGLRCPDDPFAAALLSAAGGPVVAASANYAGQMPPLSGDNVMAELEGKIDLLVDRGRTKYAKPSTIVRVIGSTYELIRVGVYDAGIIERLSVLRLLLVCTGNTCRSPMAAVMAKKMIAERLGCDIADLARHGVVVESAGTAGGMGGASCHALTVMARRGLDLADHVSLAVSREMIQQADHVFTMTRSHRQVILDMAPAAEDRVALLLDGEDVQDPAGGSVDDYELCVCKIEKGLRARLQEVMA